VVTLEAELVLTIVGSIAAGDGVLLGAAVSVLGPVTIGAAAKVRKQSGPMARKAPAGALAPTTDGKSKLSVLRAAYASAACSAACRRVGSSLFQHLQQYSQPLCHMSRALPCIDPRLAPAAWSPWTCRRRAWRWACRRASSRPTTSRRRTWTSATTTSTTTSSEKRTCDAGGIWRRSPLQAAARWATA
jgi:hypothetical protein